MTIQPILAHCTFEKHATGVTLAFDAFVIVACGVTLFLLRRGMPKF